MRFSRSSSVGALQIQSTILVIVAALFDKPWLQNDTPFVSFRQADKPRGGSSVWPEMTSQWEQWCRSVSTGAMTSIEIGFTIYLS
jgi:hypothetical protein